MNSLYKKCYLTYALVAANIVMFIIESLLGGSENPLIAVRFGALFTPYVMGKGEYYRLFTSMFLHFGFEHLFSNMFTLIAMGPYIEKIFGRINYLIIYLAAGLIGNVLFVASAFFKGSYALSVGASGAIFGLFGTIVFLSLIPRYRRLFPVKNVIMGLIINLSYGLSDPQINLTAHVGGLIGGFLVAGISYYVRKALKRV